MVRVPDVAQEQVAGQDAAPRVRAVRVGRAAGQPQPAPAEECLVDGRLSDRGLGSTRLGLGSRSVLLGWFRCAPLLRRLLLCRYRGARPRF